MDFYACLDTGFVKYCPQSLQHLAVANKASKMSGSISFYTMEDFRTLDSQLTARAKIEERPAVAGIIYFTTRQFFYGGALDVKMLRFILDQGYEVHFAREDISIRTKEDLIDIFPMLYSAQYILDRDETPNYWQPVWDRISAGSL